jgi:nucleoside-diphosphate-sugar epimerase
MPIVAPKSTILLTGASGFIAVHLGQQLLQRGFKVRGTVRSAAKGQFLVDLYAKEGLTEFEYVIVEDIEREGIFDECVKGVDGIAHTASPFHFDVSDPSQLINPAVQGTVNILRSALKEPKVQRVVITSSVASILNPAPEGYVFTEADWNTHSPEQVTLKGKDCSGVDAYLASKTVCPSMILLLSY